MSTSIDLKKIKMKMVVAPLKAIVENEEEEGTEIIQDVSDRKEKNVLYSLNNPNSDPLGSNIQLPLYKKKERSIQSHMIRQAETPPVMTLKNSSKLDTNNSLLNQTESIQTGSSMNLKESYVIIPDNAAFSTWNENQITFQEVFNYYSSYFLQFKNANGTNLVMKSKGKSNSLCCLRGFIVKHMSRYKLDKELKSDKCLLLFLADTPFDITNDLHWKLAQTIYFKVKDITNAYYNGNAVQERNNSTIQKKRGEWNLLFESDTPDFPIAKGGIYSMIQMLFIIDKYPTYFKELCKLLFDEQMNKISIIDFLSSITALCLEYVNNNELNVYFNQKRNLSDTIIDFYIGCIYQTDVYLRKESIVPFSYDTVQNVLEKTKKDVLKTPSSILWKCKQFKENYPEEGSDNVLSLSTL